MLTSSPSHSPALSPGPSPTAFSSRGASNASYRTSHSPRQTTRLPPPTFPKRSPTSPKNSVLPVPLRSLAVSELPIPPPRKKVDAATQWSPPTYPAETRGTEPTEVDPVASSATDEEKGGGKGKGKRRDTSGPEDLETAEYPREPALQPQMISRVEEAPTVAQPSVPQVIDSTSPTKRARPRRPAAKILPTRYEHCDVKDLVILISDMLMELVQFNDGIPLGDGRLTRFHSRAPPGISVSDYLQRLTTHATLSPPILLSMVYYIDCLCTLYPAFTISSLTVHRFLITAATVASKGLSDSFWTNSTYARVGGVSLRELALLELEFLWRVHWRIVPKPEVLVDYYRSLIERCEGYEIGSDPGVAFDSGVGAATNAPPPPDAVRASQINAERPCSSMDGVQ